MLHNVHIKYLIFMAICKCLQCLGFSVNEEATKKVISKSYLNFSVVAISKMIELD